jgi:putative oxidoreductase
MSLVRRIARPLLSSIFIAGGMDSLRNPGSKAPAAEGVASAVAAQIPGIPADDTEQLVKINAAVQLGAGTLLAMGKLPRLSAFALALSLVPTTAAGHRFWEETEPGTRAAQQIHFLKNVSLLGGLLIAAVDLEGRPGLAYRASAARKSVARSLPS